MSDTLWSFVGLILLALAAYCGYLLGKMVGRIESAEDRRLASETWRLSREVNRVTNEVINETQKMARVEREPK